MDKYEWVAKLQSRQKQRLTSGMRYEHFHLAAIDTFFEVAGELLAELEKKKEKPPEGTGG
jgi:hypothetical protein